jgi:hypothetical protein
MGNALHRSGAGAHKSGTMTLDRGRAEATVHAILMNPFWPQRLAALCLGQVSQWSPACIVAYYLLPP